MTDAAQTILPFAEAHVASVTRTSDGAVEIHLAEPLRAISIAIGAKGKDAVVRCSAPRLDWARPAGGSKALGFAVTHTALLTFRPAVPFNLAADDAALAAAVLAELAEQTAVEKVTVRAGTAKELHALYDAIAILFSRNEDVSVVVIYGMTAGRQPTYAGVQDATGVSGTDPDRDARKTAAQIALDLLIADAQPWGWRQQLSKNGIVTRESAGHLSYIPAEGVTGHQRMMLAANLTTAVRAAHARLSAEPKPKPALKDLLERVAAAGWIADGPLSIPSIEG